ncbi:hypothetical protein HDU96_001139 [Phlyctochytrium bullatum]|nr:hypothetical protein HDU96_001139 [Phlyctochytrium bullatum]
MKTRTRTLVGLSATLTLLFGDAALAALNEFNPITTINCSDDRDCNAINLRLPKTEGAVGYACVNKVCTLLAGAGEFCKRASDCVQYQYVSRELQRNRTIESIVGRPVSNASVYLEGLCSPYACTIASGCGSFSDPLFSSPNQLLLPEYTPGQACCVGGRDNDICSTLTNLNMQTCDVNMKCQAAGTPENPISTCRSVDLKSQQWVGVVLCLIGGSMINVGLNLQKLALRKRHEKKQEKKLRNRMRIIQKLAAIRLAPIRLPSFAGQGSNGQPLGKRSRTPSFQNLFNRNRENSNATVTAAADAAAAAAAAASAEAMGHLHAGDSLSPRGSTPTPPNDEVYPHLAGGQTTVPAKAAGSSASFFSFSSLGRNRSGRHSVMSETPSEVASVGTMGRPASRGGSRYMSFGIELPRPTLRITNNDTIQATVTRPDGTTEDISIPAADEDKAEFAKSLDFLSLLKNPIWLLGFIIFALGNFVNFAALQYAPQSLVATLGSISLVWNVILAPIINREKFTWRDVVGVVLIVAGSSLTVVFSGVNSKDYKLCVLLALFRRVPTILFLTLTCSAVAAIFLLICFIEKNLDLKPALGQAHVTTTAPVQDDGGIKLPANRESVLAWTSKMSAKAYGLPGRIARRTSDMFHNVSGRLSRVGSRGNPPNDGGEAGDMELTSARSHPEDPASPGAESDLSPTQSRAAAAASPVAEADSSSPSSSITAGPEAVDAVPVSDSSAQGTHDEEDGSGFLVVAAPHLPVAPASSGTVASPAVEIGLPPLPNTADLEPRRPRNSAAPSDRTLHTTGLRPGPSAAAIAGSSGGLLEVPKAAFAADADALAAVAKGSASQPLEGGSGTRMVTTTTVIGMEEAMAAEAEGTMIEDGETTKKPFKERMYEALPPFVKNAITWWHNVDILPRLQKKIPLESRVVTVLLPFSYASLGGLMGTLTVLFAKATIHLLTSSLFEGDNQYNNIFAWLITAVTVITAVSQVYWINMGLQRYDALLQIPVYYVVWTIFDVVGGGIYFNEFEGFSTRQYGLFFLAVGIIFIGVFVLGDRLKNSHV